MSFEWSCKNARLEGLSLYADCRRIDGSYRPSSLPLDTIIGTVDGAFKWGYKYFSSNARDVSVQGSLLKATLKKSDGTWVEASLSLGTNIVNADGILKAVNLPMVIAVPQESEEAFGCQLAETIEKNPDLKIQVVEEKDGATLWYVNAGAGLEDGTFFKTLTGDARASVMHLVQSKGKKIEQVNVDVFTAQAGFNMTGVTDGTGGGFPVYIGADASLNLFKAQASVFDLNLGIGVETGAGLKDGSIDAHVLGCGITIGRKVGISAFGSGFAIDFGRFFD